MMRFFSPWFHRINPVQLKNEWVALNILSNEKKDLGEIQTCYRLKEENIEIKNCKDV